MSDPASLPACAQPLLAQLRAQQQGGYGAPSLDSAMAIHVLPLISGEKEQHLVALDALQRSGVIAGHSYIDASSGPAMAVVDAPLPG